MSSDRKLIKSTGVIGFATFSSRIFGFLRDVLFAKLFGTNIYAQAFVVAFRIPNMLRDMIGEGATNAAIVPVLTEYKHKHSEKEYWDAAAVIFNLMVAVLLVLSCLGVIFAPFIVRIMAPGFIDDPEKFSSAVFLTKWLFPYIFFLGLLAYSKGVLNSFQYFASPEYASSVLNITSILAILFICPSKGVNGLIIGVLLGGVLQVAMQVRPMMRIGFSFGEKIRFIHPAATRIGKLLLPRIWGSAVYQLSVLIDTVLASLWWVVGSGGVAALYYAHRLVHLPLAIFGISMATASLPQMSKEVALNDMAKLKKTIEFSLKTVFFTMIPAAVGLMVLSGPIIRILFQRGEFTEYSTLITSNALFFYSFGLIAYAGIKILVNVYFSMGDTMTPVKAASISLVINLLLNLILMWPLKVGGLALATSIAATINFFLLAVILQRRIGSIGAMAILDSFIRTGLAALIMAFFVLMSKNMFLTNTASNIGGLFTVFIVMALSFLVFFLSSYILGVDIARRSWKAALGK